MSWHIRQKPNRNRRGTRTNSGLLRLWKIHFHPSFKIFYNLVVHPLEKPKANTDRCFLPTKPIFGPTTHNTCKEWEVWDFRTWSRQTEWFSSHTRYSELEHNTWVLKTLLIEKKNTQKFCFSLNVGNCKMIPKMWVLKSGAEGRKS